MDEAHRKAAEEKHNQEVEEHKKHEKVNHPVKG
jgi:hypothetical protein